MVKEQITKIYMVINRASCIYYIGGTLEEAQAELQKLEQQGKLPNIVEIEVQSDGNILSNTLPSSHKFNPLIHKEVDIDGQTVLVRKNKYMRLDEFADLIQGWNSDSTDDWRVKIGYVKDGQAESKDFLGIIHPDYINKVFTLFAFPEEE